MEVFFGAADHERYLRWLEWRAEEDAMIGTLSASEVAEHTGRTISAVTIRRRKLASMKVG